MNLEASKLIASFGKSAGKEAYLGEYYLGEHGLRAKVESSEGIIVPEQVKRVRPHWPQFLGD